MIQYINPGVILYTNQGPGEAVMMMLNEVFNIKIIFIRLKFFPEIRKFTWTELLEFPTNFEALSKLNVRFEENY